VRAILNLSRLAILKNVDLNGGFVDEAGMHEFEGESSILSDPIGEFSPIADIPILVIA
jgi:hypothetical protein